MNWKNLVDAFLDAFRMPTEEAGRLHATLSSYGHAQNRLNKLKSDEAVDYLKVGDPDAMMLSIGSPHQWRAEGGWRVWVHDICDNTEGTHPWAAYGETHEQCLARAKQLVSALDGARRL